MASDFEATNISPVREERDIEWVLKLQLVLTAARLQWGSHTRWAGSIAKKCVGWVSQHKIIHDYLRHFTTVKQQSTLQQVIF